MSANSHMLYQYIVGKFLKSLLMGPTVYKIYVYLATHMVGSDFCRCLKSPPWADYLSHSSDQLFYACLCRYIRIDFTDISKLNMN